MGKKDNKRKQREKELRRKGPLNDTVSKGGSTATIVRQTDTAPVTIRTIRVPDADEEPSHSSSESVREIIPITKDTEKALREWVSVGIAGKVSVKTVAPVPTQDHLITVVFGRTNRSKTLIAYNALGEKVYGLTPHNKGHKPEKGKRCLCKKPRLDLKPLFYIKGKPVYTTMVLPTIREKNKVNRSTPVFFI